jgi:hypothetical protein
VSICSRWFCTGFFAELCVRPYLSGWLLWATERHNFFPPLFICLYSFLTIPRHRMFPGSRSGIDLSIKTRDKFFELFSKSLSSVRASTSSCRVHRVKRSKNTTRYASGSLFFSFFQTRKKKDKIWHMFIGCTGYCVASSGCIPIQNL